MTSATASSPGRRFLPGPRAALWTGWGFVALVAAYAAVHMAFRLAASDVVAVDEVVEAVFAQRFAWVYDPKQPPLYTWLLRLTTAVAPLQHAHFLAIKYLCLAATLLAYKAAADRVLGDSRLAALATLSLLLLYQIGWNLHEGVTHTLTLMASCALGLAVVMRLLDAPRTLDYVLLGACFALGFLSKYGFAAFVACTIAASLCQAAGRRWLLDPRLAITALIAASGAVPYLAWLEQSGTTLAALYAGFAGGGSGSGGSLLHRLGQAVAAPLGFLSPALPILLLLFPRAVLPRKSPPTVAPGVERERFLRHFLLAALAILLAGALVGGVSTLKERWMHPLFLPAPLWLWARIAHMRDGLPERRLAAFWAVFIVSLPVVLAFRASEFALGSAACSRCRYVVDYRPLVQHLAASGAAGGLVVARDEHIAGNLRTRLPDADIFLIIFPAQRPPARAYPPDARCALVWNTQRHGSAVPPELAPFAGASASPPQMATVTSSPRVWFPLASQPVATWGVAIADMAACRG